MVDVVFGLIDLEVIFNLGIFFFCEDFFFIVFFRFFFDCGVLFFGFFFVVILFINGFIVGEVDRDFFFLGDVECFELGDLFFLF